MIKLQSHYFLYLNLRQDLYKFMDEHGLLEVETNDVEIPKRDFIRLVKAQFDLTIMGYPQTVFIKNDRPITENHFSGEGGYFNQRIVEVFYQKLEKHPRYIGNQIYTDYPDVIFDIETDNLDGELREELLKIGDF